jgi:hypothetical protein
MLSAAHQRGVNAALHQFGLTSKTAGIKDWLGGAGRFLIGHPGQAFVEGPRTFSPGGLLSHENTWWPKTQGLSGAQKIMPWLQRAGTAAIPLQMMSSAHRDPHEGALSNMLGTAGQIAGFSYGMPALGLLGAPVLGEIGARAGHGIGHLLGSQPKDPL